MKFFIILNIFFKIIKHDKNFKSLYYNKLYIFDYFEGNKKTTLSSGFKRLGGVEPLYQPWEGRIIAVI
jgi:hypothetical protein